jgi:hypothetical protein
MARTVSTETRQDLLQSVRERYRGSLKEEKLRILDEFVAVTGYHRKHIIRLFNAAPVAGSPGRRARLPVYDEAVREALILLWEASDRICGKRLKPLVPLLVTALERHGHLTLDVTVRARVLAASFVHTLTLTDVASGWTECVALVVRDGALVVAALEQLRQTMPFPLRGFDTDNGGGVHE